MKDREYYKNRFNNFKEDLELLMTEHRIDLEISNCGQCVFAVIDGKDCDEIEFIKNWAGEKRRLYFQNSKGEHVAFEDNSIVS